MKISIDIIERSFRDYVVKTHILDNAEVSLRKCAFFDPSETASEETIYLCRNSEQIDAEKLPYNCNLIFVEPLPDFDSEQLKHVNYLVVAGIPVYRLFNNLLEVFYKYDSFDRQLSLLIEKKCSYQELIDLGTKMIEMPMCMINLNYQPVALSAVDVPGDDLWKAMQDGYGVAYYDFIQRCEFKTEEMAKSGISKKSAWSELASNYICVSVLYLNGRAVGSIGMHKWYERKKPFEKAALQLFDYFVSRVSKRIQILHDIPESRYAPMDMLLIELLDGKEVDKQEVCEMLEKIGLPMNGTFHLAVFYPKEESCRTERLLDYMEMIEQLYPGMHCCIYNATIIALHVVSPKDDIRLKKRLLSFLREINYYCIYGLEYNSLMETQKAYKTLEILKKDILTREELECVCYAHNYLIEYAMTVLSKYMDISKLMYPALKTLMEHDAKGKSDLYNVLRTFLYNKCSLKATSDSLFLHRNTLASRIATIKEIVGIDLEDEKTYKQMLFSVFCMDYCEKMGKKVGYFPPEEEETTEN